MNNVSCSFINILDAKLEQMDLWSICSNLPNISPFFSYKNSVNLGLLPIIINFYNWVLETKCTDFHVTLQTFS